MWEAEKREIKATTLSKIAHVFGVTLDEIINLQKGVLTGREENMRTKTKTAKTKEKKTKFELKAPAAKKVRLVGDFNAWDAKGLTMRKTRTGSWNLGLNLKPGSYEYKFLVDGEWWTDPANSNTRSNTFGSVNSVREVGV